MGATEDPELLKETFQFMMERARDQDVVYFFRGLGANFTARRPLAQFFKDQYDVVSVHFSFCKFLAESSGSSTNGSTPILRSHIS